MSLHCEFVVNFEIVFVESVMNLCDSHNFLIVELGLKQYHLSYCQYWVISNESSVIKLPLRSWNRANNSFGQGEDDQMLAEVIISTPWTSNEVLKSSFATFGYFPYWYQKHGCFQLFWREFSVANKGSTSLKMHQRIIVELWRHCQTMTSCRYEPYAEKRTKTKAIVSLGKNHSELPYLFNSKE